MSGAASRVVVTGLGACSALGSGARRLFAGLLAAKSGIATIGAFDASRLRSRIAGEVRDFDAAAHFDDRDVKRSARFSQLAVVAAREALDWGGFAAGPEREDVAVVIGSGIGGFDVLEREHQRFLERGPGKFAPLTVPIIIPNMAAANVATDTGCRGPNLCLSTACATGAHAIGTALDLLRSGRASAALAGASESTISPFAVDGYCQVRALSQRNHEPTAASRPFDRDRDGFVIAEGAAVLLLEREDAARRRGAQPLAELAGYGASADGHHLTAPDPDGAGAVRAMRAALCDARLEPADVDVINAHGTSTALNDRAETRALKTVFGDSVRRLWVHATKSMIGHALGAAGALEAVVSVLTLLEGAVHSTLNLENADPACDLDYVPGAARSARVRAVLSNSFAFGGHNAVLAFRRWQD